MPVQRRVEMTATKLLYQHSLLVPSARVRSLCCLFQEVWLALGRTLAGKYVDKSDGKVPTHAKWSCSKQALFSEAGVRDGRCNTCALWLERGDQLEPWF